MTAPGPDDSEPWWLPGLPAGLTPEHFEVAARVWASHARQPLGEDELRPLLGPGGAHFRLSGMHYDNNATRIAALARVTPLAYFSGMRQLPAGPAAVYPVILLQDPTQPENEATPVAVCAVTGYIGSAWGAHRQVAAQVPRRLRARGRLLVTVAALAIDDLGPWATVWLPTPDTPA